MEELKTIKISISEDYKSVLDEVSDDFDIFSYQHEQRWNIFKKNPNSLNFLDNYLLLYVMDGKIVGRCYYFPTKLKVNQEIVPALSASALYVAKAYRPKAIGADIVMHSTFSEDYSTRIFSGISPMALPVYKKLKYKIFTLQRCLIRLNFHAYLRNKRLSGIFLNVATILVNYFYSLPRKINGHVKLLSRRFSVKEMDVIPHWVEDIVLNDGHSYMEIHDCKWFQWQLSGAFRKGERNNQKFFGIYEQDNPVGFFMTKERMIDEANGIVIGSIVEWGTKNENVLDECSIYELSLQTFCKDVYLVDFASDNQSTIRRMRRLGFSHVGEENILFYDNDKRYTTAKDASQWRLRYGYADTIFS